MNMILKNERNSYQPPCAECGSRCCTYTAIEIDRPTTKTDCDNIRWYLVHRDVNVFVDHDRKWYVEFRSPCEHLAGDLRCGIYEDRPRICRTHGNGVEECEYFDSPYLHYFSTREQFEEYLDTRGREWRFRKTARLA